MTGWIRSIKNRNPGAPWRQLAFWEFVRLGGGLMLRVLYRFRWWDTRKIPATGPVLLIANHQSFFDLLAIGMAVPHRHFHGMARKTLFDNPLFARWITMLNAFGVDQEKADLKAMRTAIERLKQGHMVLIFPEGSRTPDGATHDFQDGIMLVIRRAKPTVVPIALDGIHDVYPMGAKRPALTGRIGALCGDPISSEELLAMEPADARRRLENEVETLRVELRGRIRKQTRGRWPLPGPGDTPAFDVKD